MKLGVLLTSRWLFAVQQRAKFLVCIILCASRAADFCLPANIEIKRIDTLLMTPFIQTLSPRMMAGFIAEKPEHVRYEIPNPRAESLRFSSVAADIENPRILGGFTMPSLLCNHINTVIFGRRVSVIINCLLKDVSDLIWAMPGHAIHRLFSVFRYIPGYGSEFK